MDEPKFKNPPSEFRGAPFWSWNCKLEKEELMRQIDVYREMAIGGFHIHCRTGLETPYLGEEYMDLVKASVDKAKAEDMKVWLYDEDRWPSGFGGGLVTENPEFRMQYLLFTPRPYGSSELAETNISCAAAGRSENGELLARYAVSRDGNGDLEHFHRLTDDEDITSHSSRITIWYAYLEKATPSAWFNDQTYVNTLKKEATECFLQSTHERYKKAIGLEFGKTVSGIFTDEPQFSGKQCFATPDANEDRILPFTDELPAEFSARYGRDLLDALPELFWELPGRAPSVVRYRYHDLVADLFAQNYAGVLGAWCRENNLQLTGHMMSEASLSSQSESLGEAMRSYIHFGLPGIDILNDLPEYTTAKQAQSVARQLGAPGTMSELYGVTNWDYDFKGHKAQGDWQAAMGVVLRVHHLTWVSMKGEAKRDFPASIGYQSPWYQRYPLVEDHFARVNVALTTGWPLVRVGVIHPIESYWLAYGPSSQTGAERADRDHQFEEINRILLFGLVDYDLIAESLLPVQCDPQKIDATLPVGEMRYEVVIVPGMRTIRGSTLDRLERFVDAGGTLLFVGEVPSLVDAEPSSRPAELAARAACVDFSAYAILRRLGNVRELRALNADGTPAQDLMHQFRQDGDERLLFVCSTNRIESKKNLSLQLRGEWICHELDTQTGEKKRMSCVYKNGETHATATLHPTGSLLLSMQPAEPQNNECRTRNDEGFSSPRLCASAMNQMVECDRLPDPESYSLDEPNVLLLDQARWNWNDGPMNGREELLRLDTKLRAQIGARPRNGMDCQPWADTEPAPVLGTLTLQFDFDSELEFSDCELAVEEPECKKIELNGKAIETGSDNGWWVDRCIRKVPLPNIRKGKNALCIKIPYNRKTDVEWCYLLGEFGVRLEGSRGVLVPLPKTLPYGDWTRNGLPFYAGNVDYTIRLPEQPVSSIQIPFFKGALVDCFKGNRLIGSAAFPPYSIELPGMNAGAALTLRVYGNRVNSFGQIHNTDEHRNDWVRFGPLGYRSEGRDWAYEYQLRPMGILTAPLLTGPGSG